MASIRPDSVQRGSLVWSLVLLSGAVVLRAGLAHYDHSVFWPDEIHQSLEQAHRAVFGYGLVPWEFRDGARSWLFPGMIAALWKLCATFGIDSSLTLVMIARLAFVAASVVSIWFAAKIAAALAGPRAGLAVAAILMTFPPSVVFAYRAMSETASAPLVVLGAWFFVRRRSQDLVWAGLCLSLACLLRYQNGLFVVVLLAALLLQRRWREAYQLGAAGLAIAVLGGLLDWVTWGRPFHSLLVYVDFNLVQSGASSFGVEPFGYYIATLWSSAGPAIIVLLLGFCVGAFVQPVLGGAVLCYLFAHSVLPHKEVRFLVPCLPLLATVSAIGFERLIQRLPAPRLIAAASAIAVTASFAFRLRHLTYEEMGQYAGTERAGLSVWQNEQDSTLLLADAGERPDLCGVEVLGSRAAFTGGYTYLHRDVPLIYAHEVCDTAPVNYIIGPIGRALPSAYRLEQQRGLWGLFRREGECQGHAAANERWLEGAPDMGLRRLRAEQASDGSLRFDLQRDAGSFVQGWGNGESIACGPARWSIGQRSVIEFDFEPGERAYQLNLRATAHEAVGQQRFTLAVNGRRIFTSRLASRFETFAVDIPNGALHSGVNQVELLFARSARGSGEDARQLSALFRRIEIAPKRDDFSVDLAVDSASHHLSRGFFPSERADGVSFVWSDGPVSEIEGNLVLAHTAYVLTVVGESVPFVPKQRARVYVNDIQATTLGFSTHWQTHRVLVPRQMLKVGKNRIRFEYDATAKPAQVDPSLTDQRELAVRFRSIQLDPVTAGRALEIGSASARPFLFEGWSGDERDGDRTVVWTDGSRASVLLSLSGIDRPVLRMQALAYARALPMNVGVYLNGDRVGWFAAAEGWQDVAVPLPRQGRVDGGDLISLEFDRTARPSDYNPNSEDHRSLALRVDRIWVESEGPGGTVTASVKALR